MNETISGSRPAEPTSDDSDDPDPRVTLECVVRQGDWSAFGQTEDLVGALAGKLAVAISNNSFLDLEQPGCAAVALSDDDEVRQLNQAFRGLDKPTNVLSFPAVQSANEPGAPVFLGDIIIAAETVATEAAQKRIAPSDHLAHLMVHGVLHLLGFDHETDAAADEMERIETNILAAVGIADPYCDHIPVDAKEAVHHPG